MKLRPAAARPLLPIPPSVLLTLLWVGLVRLLFLFVMAKAQTAAGYVDGDIWLRLLLEERVLGRGRLPTLLVAVSFLLLLYLWLDYRSRAASGARAVVFLLAAALLVYLGWAIWHLWWTQLPTSTEPVKVLMTICPAAPPIFGRASR